MSTFFAGKWKVPVLKLPNAMWTEIYRPIVFTV